MCSVAWTGFEFAIQLSCLLAVTLSQRDRLVLYRTQSRGGLTGTGALDAAGGVLSAHAMWADTRKPSHVSWVFRHFCHCILWLHLTDFVKSGPMSSRYTSQ